MTPEDLARVHTLAFTEYRPWDAGEFEALLGSKYCFFVGDSRGFALGRAIAGESELLTLAVDPKFQRMGLGRKFLKQYHDAAAKRGAKSYLLEVARDNIAAIKLYKSAGYIQDSCRKDYYKRSSGQMVDALILRMTSGEAA